MKQDKKRKGSSVSLIVLFILFGIIIYSGYNLYIGFQDYWNNYLNSLEIGEDAGRDEKTVDWESLLSKNDEVFGWIYCEGTRIDYPVVKGTDNSKYLNVGADGTYNRCGALFINCYNTKPLEEPNTIIYGHHMKDGSMFHDLDYWQDADYFKEHSEFYFYTPRQNYKLTAVAAENVSCDDVVIYGVPFTNEEDTSAFINKVISNTDVSNDDIVFSEKDSFVTLSTCAYDFVGARSIIVCNVEPVDERIEDIEESKPDPESKLTVFLRMVKEIIKEEINNLSGGSLEE